MGGPTPSSPEVTRRMRATKRRDTPAELALRSELHARGLRYRVDWSPVVGIRRRADVVFKEARVAVYVDGCFWHGCPQHATWPKSNAQWWRSKIEGNVARDRDTDALLEARGWAVIRVWEHDGILEAAERVVRAVRRAGRGAEGPGPGTGCEPSKT